MPRSPGDSAQGRAEAVVIFEARHRGRLVDQQQSRLANQRSAPASPGRALPATARRRPARRRAPATPTSSSVSSARRLASRGVRPLLPSGIATCSSTVSPALGDQSAAVSKASVPRSNSRVLRRRDARDVAARDRDRARIRRVDRGRQAQQRRLARVPGAGRPADAPGLQLDAVFPSKHELAAAVGVALSDIGRTTAARADRQSPKERAAGETGGPGGEDEGMSRDPIKLRIARGILVDPPARTSSPLDLKPAASRARHRACTH